MTVIARLYVILPPLKLAHDQTRCRKTGDWWSLLRYSVTGLSHEISVCHSGSCFLPSGKKS